MTILKKIFRISPRLKTVLLCLFVISTCVLVYFLYQKGQHRFRDHRGFGRSEEAVSEEFKGTITKFITNQAGDIDGFVLNTNKDTLKFYFPPHTASLMMETAQAGNEVKINAYKRHEHYRITELWNLTNEKHIQIAEVMPPDPEQTQGAEKNFKFTEYYFIIDRKGRIAGIASGKVMAIFKPKTIQNVIEHIKSNSEISVSGIERPKDMGYINQKFETIIHATSIQIDGNVFVLQ